MNAEITVHVHLCHPWPTLSAGSSIFKEGVLFKKVGSVLKLKFPTYLEFRVVTDQVKALISRAISRCPFISGAQLSLGAGTSYLSALSIPCSSELSSVTAQPSSNSK